MVAKHRSNTQNVVVAIRQRDVVRVNGFAAGVALLEIYEAAGDDRAASFDSIPIQEFVDKLAEVDKRALPAFWMVVHDYLTIVADGCTPQHGYFTEQLNLGAEDVRKVRVQLGYEWEGK